MAILHRATITPTKAELIAEWVPTRSWGPSAADSIEVVGAYRFDDPDGRVGMETHLVSAGGALIQVPLTYRDEPLEGAEDALITEMQHSVLGTRWVYDGLRDPRLVLMLAAVTMTGQGEALGMVESDGRWYITPSKVRIQGGGWTAERVPVDGFELESDEAAASVLHNDRFDLTVFRRPVPGTQPAIGLTATWDGQVDPVVLAEVRETVGKEGDVGALAVRILVIDAANVIGSRPTGWWRDRPGAARRLTEQVRATVTAGRLDPPVTIVLEGQARMGADEADVDGVAVVHAPGEADDTIAVIAETYREVVVVTADRELAERVRAANGAVVGPSWLLDRLVD